MTQRQSNGFCPLCPPATTAYVEDLNRRFCGGHDLGPMGNMYRGSTFARLRKQVRDSVPDRPQRVVAALDELRGFRYPGLSAQVLTEFGTEWWGMHTRRAKIAVFQSLADHAWATDDPGLAYRYCDDAVGIAWLLGERRIAQIAARAGTHRRS